MSNQMNLGTQTGSLVNHIYSGRNNTPEVGKGCTILLYSDRHAYQVLEVSEDKKKVVIQRCDSKRTDNLGMSDSQTYDYSELTGSKETICFKYNQWCRVSKTVEFDNDFYKEFEAKTSGKSGKEYKDLYDSMITPLFDENNVLMLIEGKTKLKTNNNKINVIFGVMDEHYDYTR